ncbi:hypothetical protein CMI38_02140 [Candidatus Pacearchaeota archaeon]|jgi:hypothetical protein|nr:hypothetical protein [Candidatus Pacearchaeota archaeon]|tara:strand:+ start:3650 stop:3985 length:336 start_codon:yes stop_codon:yes gene_type:complete
MTEYNEAQVWSVVHGNNHPSLQGDERSISGYIPLVEELFPGINYFSTTGFNQVIRDYAQPALKKLFPEMVDKPADEVSRDRTVNVDAFLPSDGYEHSDNPEWKGQLEALLA